MPFILSRRVEGAFHTSAAENFGDELKCLFNPELAVTAK